MSGVKNRVTVKGTVQARKTVRGGIGYRTLQGEPGKDGISPQARVDKSGDTATITITDAEGTTTATVTDGKTPQKGVDYLTPGEVHEVAEEVLQDEIITDIQDDISDVKGSLNQKYEKPSTGIPASDLASGAIPDVSVKADKVQNATSGNFASLDANGNLTDSGHKHSDYLTEAPVTDVQVNGTSILNQSVANIPKASSSSLGIVRGGITGIGINNDGQLFLSSASEGFIKSGTNSSAPIAPNNQHISAFYGLAKAAGDTTQSSSSNAVGTYTDDAKIKIQKMLGIYQPPWELLNDITLDEETGIELTADSNGVPYDLLGVFVRIYYVANLPTVDSGYGRYRFYDIDNIFIHTETGRYQTYASVASKFIYVMRDSNLAHAVYSTRSSTGGGMSWQMKEYGSSGTVLNLGNIVRITTFSTDAEPAGTRIQVFGQRAY